MPDRSTRTRHRKAARACRSDRAPRGALPLDEIETDWARYTDIQPKLGEAFVDSIEQALNLAREFPEMGGVALRVRYAIVIEKTQENYSAYVPDLRGCIATGATVEEAEAGIREAIIFHVEGLREDGLTVPPGESTVDYVNISVQQVLIDMDILSAGIARLLSAGHPHSLEVAGCRSCTT